MSALESSLASGVVLALREQGFAPRPRLLMHVVMPDGVAQVVGDVTCRPWVEAWDADAALCSMAQLPVALGASEGFWVWEDAMLAAALRGPGDHPCAVVTARVTGSWYELTRRPFMPAVGVGPDGLSVVARPSAPISRGGCLPGPIFTATAAWMRRVVVRTPSKSSAEIVEEMRERGYEIDLPQTATG